MQCPGFPNHVVFLGNIHVVVQCTYKVLVASRCRHDDMVGITVYASAIHWLHGCIIAMIRMLESPTELFRCLHLPAQCHRYPPHYSLSRRCPDCPALSAHCLLSEQRQCNTRITVLRQCKARITVQRQCDARLPGQIQRIAKKPVPDRVG